MIYDNQLSKSNNYLSKGYTIENFQDAKVWFLDSAYLNGFNE
jgi:hypothetical protein